MVITAAGFLDKYGPADALDYLPWLSRIQRPHLILLAGQTLETNPAFADLEAALTALSAVTPWLTCETIPGADINFRHDPSELWRCLQAWFGGRKV